MASILIAEDSSVIQNLIKKVLSQASNEFEFKTVKNGKSLISEAEKKTYDILLVDINIPQVNGIDCVKEIRKNVSKKLPIIAITGNADNLSLEEYRKLGFTDLLEKPLNFDLLVQKVKKHLS